MSLAAPQNHEYLQTEWIVGSGHPTDLRAGGWVYLRSEGRLWARARARRSEFREERRARTGEVGSDFGPGVVIIVYPETWEACDYDLGDVADSQHQGYRYLLTMRNGHLVHLSAGESIPDDIDWEPAFVPRDNG